MLTQSTVCILGMHRSGTSAAGSEVGLGCGCIDFLNHSLTVRSALSQMEILILQDHADDACKREK